MFGIRAVRACCSNLLGLDQTLSELCPVSCDPSESPLTTTDQCTKASYLPTQKFDLVRVQKLYPTPAWNGIALELLGANREKYAKRCLSITRKVTEATCED